MRAWREVRDDLCWKPGCSEGRLCPLDEKTETMFDSFPCCVFSPIWAKTMLEAVTFALKLSHKVAETRGLISLKCVWRKTPCFLGLPGGEGGRHSVSATRAVLRDSCSLTGTTHILSYSRPLHFEVGISKMPITAKGTIGNIDIFPVCCVCLHDQDESRVPKCENMCEHPSDPPSFPPSTKPTLCPNQATCSPREFICRVGDNVFLLFSLGPPSVACLEKWSGIRWERHRRRRTTSSGGQWACSEERERRTRQQRGRRWEAIG